MGFGGHVGWGKHLLFWRDHLDQQEIWIRMCKISSLFGVPLVG
jgi:hypothetical protein